MKYSSFCLNKIANSYLTQLFPQSYYMHAQCVIINMNLVVP